MTLNSPIEPNLPEIPNVDGVKPSCARNSDELDSAQLEEAAQTFAVSESDLFTNGTGTVSTRLIAIGGLDWQSAEEKVSALLNCFELEREQFTKNDLGLLLGYLAASPLPTEDVRIKEASKSIFDAVSNISKDLDPEETVKFINLARILKYEDPFIQESRSRCFENIHQLPENRAFILCKCILSSRSPEEDKSKVVSWFTSQLPQFSETSCMQTMEVVAASKLPAGEFAEKMISRMQDFKDTLSRRDFIKGLANLAHIKDVSRQSQHRLSQMIYDSRLEYRPDLFISAACKLVLNGYSNPEFVRAVAEHSLNRGDCLSGKECAQLVKMFDVTQWRHPGYLNELGNRMSDMAFHTDPHLLVEVAVSFAKLDIRIPRLMSSLSTLSPTKLGVLSANKLKAVLGACAAENIIPINLLSFIDEELPKKEKAERYLASSMWSYSLLNEPCPNILSKMREVYPELVKTGFFNCGDAALVMRASVVLDPELGREFWQSFYKSKSEQPVNIEGLAPSNQLDQEISKLKGPPMFSLYHSLVSLKLEVPEELKRKALSMERYQEYAVPRMNPFEFAVGRELDRIGVKAEAQKWFEGYYIDFLLDHGGRKIALECDGFKYHSAGMQAQSRLNGKSIMKEEFLKARGFEVIRIPSREWAQNPDRQSYLSHLLNSDLN
jgi:very-short-patch-repair endonuclease